MPSTDRVPRPRTDLIRPLGWIGESMEPWFYERRFLRPRFARQAVLEVLRRLSAAHVLGDRTEWNANAPRSLETDVLVVGGGPAGLAAAAVTAAAGARTLVMTRGPVGGRQPRLVPARADSDVSTIREHGGDVVERTLCVGHYAGEAMFAGVSDRGPLTIRAERVVVATGAYDRALVVPGVDLPGVIGGRAFEQLTTQGAFTARHRIGVFAAPVEAARIATAAAACGVELAWVAGPGDVPMKGTGRYPGRRLRRIDGRRVATGAVLDDGRRLAADVVVLGFTQPTYELQMHLGQTASIGGEPAIVLTAGATSMPMLVVGEAAGDVDPDGAADRAAARAASWLEHPTDVGQGVIEPGVAAIDGLDPDATVCVCEDVTVAAIDRAIADGFGDIELLKRRSGACTGACQGKLCLGAVGEVLQARGLAAGLPTMRPPIRPVSIASLAGEIV
jgi:sarcosine oxidase subunit alpha